MSEAIFIAISTAMRFNRLEREVFPSTMPKRKAANAFAESGGMIRAPKGPFRLKMQNL
ncbi:MAG: hypothetical protein QM605_16500 [Sphingobium sp.]